MLSDNLLIDKLMKYGSDVWVGDKKVAELLGSKGHDPQCKVQLEANN